MQLLVQGAPVPFAEQVDVHLTKQPITFDKSNRKGVRAGDNWGFVYTSGTTGLPKVTTARRGGSRACRVRGHAGKGTDTGEGARMCSHASRLP